MSNVARPRKPKSESLTTTVQQLPVLTSWRQNDKKYQFDAIMREHDYGMFMRSAPLVDELMTDDRIAGVLNTRLGAIVSAPLEFRPAGDRRKERKIAEEMGGVDDPDTGLWQEIMGSDSVRTVMKWGLTIGVGVGEIVWRTERRRWTPRIIPWHPASIRWDWTTRRFIAQGATGQAIPLPRPDEQPRSDAKWFVWCPWGYEYGWRDALLRPLAMAYLARQWNFRDWSRYCEKHGAAIVKGAVPKWATDDVKTSFYTAISSLGAEPVVVVPQGNKDEGNFDLTLTEATSRSWEAFKAFKEALDVDIAVLLLGQNLTTEVQGGSRAASETHELVREDIAAWDSKFFKAVRPQILSWDAEFNYGDPELAPRPMAITEPPEDEFDEATALKTFGEAISALLAAEPTVDGKAILEARGVPMRSPEEVAAEEAVFAEEREAAGIVEPPAEGTPEKLTANVVRRLTFAGLPIAVENPVGSVRKWRDADGNEGQTHMLHDYGFIEGYLSGDGEELDVYIGPMEAAPDVHVVHQLKAPAFKAPDEDKVMLGFQDAAAAKRAYLAHRSDGERAFGGMSTIPLARFKERLRRRAPDTTSRIRASAVDALMRLVDRAGRTTTTLRAGRRASKRAAAYHDRVAKAGQRAAARALAVDLAGLNAEIDAAESFDDLKRRILGRFRGTNPERLANIIRKANILAHLSGRAKALQEV